MSTIISENKKIKKEESQKFKFYATLVSTVLLALLASQSGFALAIGLFLPFLFIWFLYSLYVLVSKPMLRKWQLARMGMWTTCLVIIAVAHGQHAATARGNANRIIALIDKYKTEHGTYPEDSRAIGMDHLKLRKECGTYCAYSGKEGVYFWYQDTAIGFDTQSYNFKTKIWEYHPD